MKHFFLLSTLVLFLGKAFSQLTNYVHTYNSSNEIYYNNQTKLANGDYILSGSVGWDSDAHITRFNENGDTLWTKFFPIESHPSPNYIYGLRNIAEANDGSLYFTTYDIRGVVKLDANGNEIWSKKYTFNLGASFSNNNQTFIYADGNDLLYCITGQNNSMIAFGKIDGSGNLGYCKTIDLSAYQISTNIFTQPFAMKRTLAGNTVLALNVGIDYSGGSPNLVLFEFDSNGDITWFKSYDHPTTNRSFNMSDMIIGANNDIILRGGTKINNQQGTGLMRFNSTGNLIWSTQFVDGGGTGKVVELSNGNIAILSITTLTIDGANKQAILLTDENGDFIWSRTFGASAGGSYAIGQNSDLNIVALTGDWTYGNGNTGGIQVFMADPDGNAVGCFDVIENVPQSSWTANEVNYAHPITNATPTGPTNISITPINTYNNYTDVTPGLNTEGLVSNPDCFGENGSITYSVSDGTSPYEFIWSNGTNNQNLINVPEGTYVARVSDNKKCVELDTFNVVAPAILSASFSVTNVDCFGASNGEIDITPTGGTPGYSFAWSTTASTEDLTDLGGGFYQLTITDDNGCEQQLGIGLNEPQNLIAAIANTENVSCNGLCDGEIASFGAGGVAPYTFQWNDNLLQTDDTAVGLCDGNYLLTVTDDNGCKAYSNASISEPDELLNSTQTTSADCFSANGTSTAVPSGGTAPYQYNFDGTGLGTNDTYVNLEVGSYTLDVTDNNGCTISEIFDIESNTNPVEICLVTVNTDNQNVIVWEKPIANNLAGFNIYRNVGGIYTQIGYTPYDSLSEYVDNDFGIDPTVTSYRYEIAVLDSCGGESAHSNFHETVHLTSSLGTGNEINLIWDNYEGFTYTEYEIWRDTSGLGDWHTIGTVPNTNFTYVDNTLSSTVTNVAYTIDVVLPATCTSTTNKAQDHNASRSNKSSSIANPSEGNTSSIDEALLDVAKVYPNPTNSSFTIKLNADNWSYTLTDVSGRIVRTDNILNQNQNEVDISSLSNGIYILQLNLNGTTISKRIIKN